MLPPGPRSMVGPVLGYMADAYGVFERLVSRHGDPFSMPMPGIRATVVTGNAEGVKTILTADPATFVPFRTEATAILLGEQSLFLQGGAKHRAARKLLTPPFHGTRIGGQAGLMAELAAAAMDWRAGERVNLQQVAQSIALDVIARVLFGRQSPERARQFHQTLAEGLDAVGPAVLFFKPLRRNFGGFGPWAHAQRMVGRLRALLQAEITARRDAAPGDHDDVTSALVAARYDDGSGMTDEEIRDRLSDIIVAGHETNAVAVAWAGYELCRHPAARARLVDELDSLGPDPDPARVLDLPYLEAVCHEALRLHPPLVFLTRLLARPLTLGGHDIPAGHGVSMAVRLVHTRPDVYPDPYAFRPERFLDRVYSPFEFLPFGGGAKRCIGAAFGLQEVKLILATLLGRYRFALERDRPIRPSARAITVAPRGGVDVIVTPRIATRRPVVAAAAPCVATA